MIRIALIGAGGIARKHAECLRENPRATIVGVLDGDRDATERLAGEYDGGVTGNTVVEESGHPLTEHHCLDIGLSNR